MRKINAPKTAIYLCCFVYGNVPLIRMSHENKKKNFTLWSCKTAVRNQKLENDNSTCVRDIRVWNIPAYSRSCYTDDVVNRKLIF